MSRRPGLLLHCQHSLGLGHLVRSLALAESFAQRFRVVVVSGGRVPRNTRVPAGIELIELPPVKAAPGGGLESADGRRSLERALELRRAAVLSAFGELRPAVVVVELFPFGRKKLAGELVPLLERARAEGAVTVCSVRDILVGRGERQGEHDLRASRTANELLDLVLVHADPRVARLRDTFRPAEPLRVPVEHTGFVLPAGGAPARASAPRGVLVSAGGGLVGGPLLRAALEAHRRGAGPMRLVAGPFLPEEEWRELRTQAAGRRGLALRRSVRDLGAELATASASVSQCGYNTALDVLRSGVPALMVPFAAPGEDEQTRRARRLAELGAVRVLDPDRLGGEVLAAAIGELREFRPARLDLRTNGARRSTDLVAELVTARRPRTRARAGAGSWLDPLRRTLEAAPGPIPFFFRDDDAGWRDDRLAALLDLFGEHGQPLDVAVIPRELTPGLADSLRERVAATPGRLGLHQHGYAHANHERNGRKWEFGPARSRAEQRRDIAAGRRLLEELLGDALQPIFTPPWNRCTAETGACLVELGFEALSREAGAEPLGTSGLRELPVRVDWCKRQGGRRVERHEVGRMLGEAAAGPGPVGVMLHHAEMDGADLAAAAELLSLVASHDRMWAAPMADFLRD